MNKIPVEKKLKFLEKHKDLVLRVKEEYAKSSKDYKKLVMLARKHFKYSPKTVDGDIMASLLSPIKTGGIYGFHLSKMQR